MTDAIIEKMEALKCEAYVASLEKCPTTGKIHIQCVMHFKNARTRRGIKAETGLNYIHLERMKGTWQQAADYCRANDSEGNPKPSHVRLLWDYGDGPTNQGKRTDLEAVRDRINDGETVESMLIAGEDFGTIARNLKAFDRVEDAFLCRQFRTEMTTCEWLWGPTGVGKSHRAFTGFTPETHYVFEPSDNGWWDGYRGQETVILNDFRGNLKYEELLQLVDKYPKSVKRRNRLPMPFVSKNIIITSSLPPEQVYVQRMERDSLDQLMRRITVIEISEREPVNVVDDDSDDE